MPNIEIMGRRAHYMTPRGKRSENGEGVMFVHGAGGRGSIWHSQIKALSGKAFLCAPDLPGHGGSEGPSSSCVTDYSAFVLALADALGMERFDMVGHSMGGAISIETAVNHPDRIKRLVLVGTGGKLGVTEAILFGLANDFDGTMDMMRTFGFAPGADPDIVEPLIAELKACSPKTALDDFTACDRFDRRPDLNKIGMPTMVLCGKEDLLTPEKYSIHLHNAIAGSVLKVFENAGHMVQVEKAEEINRALLEFLFGEK